MFQLRVSHNETYQVNRDNLYLDILKETDYCKTCRVVITMKKYKAIFTNIWTYAKNTFIR